MCGIAGYAFRDPRQEADRAVLAQMSDLIRHRGPDSDGFFQSPGVGLAFRRLSIIDLSSGDQPISNEDGTVTVMCNGEIYNFVELRRQLESKGHKFRCGSDVEVIVHLYEDHGEKCVEFLRGMFAFALWDSRRRRLMLARDRFGMKPMHYADTGSEFYFGSEQKSILAVAANLDRRMDPLAVRDLLSFEYVAGARTLCRGIRRILPGYYLTYEAGQVRHQRYWDVTFPARGEAWENRKESDWADELRSRLTDVVRLHMRSDVEVGAWLSAGIDSSAVVAIASKMSSGPIRSFTLGFADPLLDETRKNPTLDTYDGYRIDNERVHCGQEEFGFFRKAIWHCEEPSTLMIPRMILSEAAARKVKVVLTGEGADELFGGYQRYKYEKLLRPFAWMPRPLRKLMLLVRPLMPRWNDEMAKIHMSAGEMRFERYFASLHGPTAGTLEEHLLMPEIKAELAAAVDEDPIPLPSEFDNWHPYHRLQYLDFRLTLPEYLNHSLDRASMAYGLEARVPFLDHELVDFCSRIPLNLKMRGFYEKHIFRKSMEEILPREVAHRRKHGLSAPYERWWRCKQLPGFAEDALSPDQLRTSGYFHPGFVQNLIGRHRRREGSFGAHLTAVLAVQLREKMLSRASLNESGTLTASQVSVYAGR